MESQVARYVGRYVAGEDGIVDSRCNTIEIDERTLESKGVSNGLIRPVSWVFALVSIDEVVFVRRDLVVVGARASRAGLNGDYREGCATCGGELTGAPDSHLRISKGDPFAAECEAFVQPLIGDDSAFAVS